MALQSALRALPERLPARVSKAGLPTPFHPGDAGRSRAPVLSGVRGAPKPYPAGQTSGRC